jgi:hypothetical protein
VASVPIVGTLEGEFNKKVTPFVLNECFNINDVRNIEKNGPHEQQNLLYLQSVGFRYLLSNDVTVTVSLCCFIDRIYTQNNSNLCSDFLCSKGLKTSKM